MAVYGSGAYGTGLYGIGTGVRPTPSFNLPALVVEIAFGSNPADANPEWTDVSASLRSFNTRRGRQFELDRVEAGAAVLTLKNQDRRFDPFNTAGPYFGTLKRMRRVRIRAAWQGAMYPVFAGYVDKWPQTWAANGKYAEVPLQVTDGFAVFSLAELNVTYASQLSSVRVNAVLDTISWGSGQAWVLGHATFGVLGSTTILAPVGDRSIGVGVSTVQASTLADASALQHLQDVVETENGLLFMGKDGSVVFLGRDVRVKPPYTTSLAIFGDGPNELAYHDLELDDDTPIWNEIRLTRNGGTEQVASDAASQATYFRRTYSRTGLLQTADSEVGSAATWRLNRYKDAGLRVRSIVVMPQRDPANLWPQVLSREIGDRVTVKRRPPGGGSVISQESYIEGVEHDVSPQGWQTRFWLSPADTLTYWILGTSTLGSTTRLSY